MKNLLRSFVALLPCVAISGCELLCQAGTGTCGMSDEQMDKLLHAKGYGEYWVRPGMTKESWQQDWVACGGMADGDFSPHVRDINTLVEQGLSQYDAEEKLKKSLKSCMQSRGYEYRREP